MFGFRSDGKKVKNIDPFMKIVPHIMFHRNDAMVMKTEEIDCEMLDKYILQKRKTEKIKVDYMDIIIASFVRVISTRPKLNRFIVNGRIYKRNNIQLSFVIKKRLEDVYEETAIKLSFDGTESIYDVIEKINQELKKNKGKQKKNATDHLAKVLTKGPNFMIKGMVRFFMWLDKHGMLPKSIIDVSPFHTSVFLVNSRSIKMSQVYHHIYNFGTTGQFVSMGKEQYKPIITNPNKKEFTVKKIMELGMVVDERICDGLYNSLSLKELHRVLANPNELDEKNQNVIKDED
ncbi:MAG: 2-oxoglutarate dehydrogenase [Candidatus Izimaplasma sp.]|nr:2-oxoglutarate dehydrogenase [Candidatus Izimaplasma bacterium]